MRAIFAGLWLICALALMAPGGALPHPIHFVVDIDHLLIDYVPDTPENRATLARAGKKFVPWNDTTTENRPILYFYAEGAEAFIQRIVDVPGSTVSFYSTGLWERNRAILRIAELKRGRGGRHTALGIANAVVSGEDMEVHRIQRGVVGPDVHSAYPNLIAKDKKDLLVKQLGFNEADLPWVMLFDDVASNAFGEQIRNLLLVARPQKAELENLSPHAWALETKKLVRTTGKLEHILLQVEATGQPPINFLFSYQFDVRDGKLAYKTALLTDRAVYAAGLASLQKADPDFKPQYTMRVVPFDEGSFTGPCLEQAIEELIDRDESLELFQLPQSQPPKK